MIAKTRGIFSRRTDLADLNSSYDHAHSYTTITPARGRSSLQLCTRMLLEWQLILDPIGAFLFFFFLPLEALKWVMFLND